MLGFASAFRRSELVALNVEDLEETPEGLLITIRRGKTDQEGLGRKVAIPRGDVACPVEAVKAWREAAGITEGALFRRVWNRRAQRVGAQRLTARIVAEVVKAGASRLALDPATFGAHSLRSGLVTTAVKRGVNLLKICDQTGHKSLEMLRVYCRDAELFVGNAAAGLLSGKTILGSHPQQNTAALRGATHRHDRVKLARGRSTDRRTSSHTAEVLAPRSIQTGDVV